MPPPIEHLESRTLLALVIVGDEQPVPMIRTSATLSDVAVADDGSYIVGAAGDNRIAVNRYTPEGRLLPGQVEFFGSDFALDMDGDGDAVVVWIGSINSKTGGMFFRTISKNGVLSAPTQLSSFTSEENAWQPNVSMDDAGNFFISYLFGTNDAPQTVEVRAAAYDAGGHLRAPKFIANSIGDSPHVWDLHVAAYPDGSGAAIVYDIEEFDTKDKHGEVLRVSTTARVGDVHKLPAQSRDPSVAMTGERSFIVGYTVWGAFEDFTRSFVKGYVQRFDGTGALAGSPVQLGASQADGGIGVWPVTVDGRRDGTFVTAYTDAEETSQTIYASRHSAGGALDGTVALSSGFTEYPTIAAGPNGRVVATYHRDRIVYARRLGSTTEPAPSHPFVLTVVGNSSGEVFRVERNNDQIRVFRGGEIIQTEPAALVFGLHLSGMGGTDNIINETDLPSTIMGGEDGDQLTGGSNRDSILGEFGGDVINGGGGNDILRGDDGDDSLSGNAGNDTIHGGAGNDRVAGNGGRDRLFGTSGNDRLYGGASGDWLYGQTGADQLFGEGGLDRLYADDAEAGGDIDTLHGNAGNDILISRDSHPDRLYGDGGDDSAYMDSDDEILSSIETIL